MTEDIFYYVVCGDIAQVTEYINGGGDVNQTNEIDYSLLHYAAEYNQVQIINILIQNGAEINLQNNENKDTPLMHAVKKHNQNAIEALLKQNADPNIQDHRGDTPLIYAIVSEKKKYVEILLKYDANPNLCSDNLETPLIWAVAKGRIDIIELLFKYDVDTTAINENGETALSMAKNRDGIFNPIYDEIITTIENYAEKKALEKARELRIERSKSSQQNLRKYIKKVRRP